jgi:hypothetical protein
LTNKHRCKAAIGQSLLTERWYAFFTITERLQREFLVMIPAWVAGGASKHPASQGGGAAVVSVSGVSTIVRPIMIAVELLLLSGKRIGLTVSEK